MLTNFLELSDRAQVSGSYDRFTHGLQAYATPFSFYTQLRITLAQYVNNDKPKFFDTTSRGAIAILNIQVRSDRRLPDRASARTISSRAIAISRILG